MEKDKCNCGIEYDDNHYPVEVLCDKHRQEKEEELKKEYDNSPSIKTKLK